MTQITWMSAVQSGLDTIVACDHDDVADSIRSLGGNAVMTDPALPSGTDRVWAAYRQLDRQYELIINLQADMPTLRPVDIARVIQPIVQQNYDVATLTAELNPADLHTDSIVKAITVSDRTAQHCCWFTRQPISYAQRHLGIYAYRPETLQHIARTAPCPAEQSERLEQLRFYQLGYRIGAVSLPYIPCDFNTVDDLSGYQQASPRFDSDRKRLSHTVSQYRTLAFSD